MTESLKTLNLDVENKIVPSPEKGSDITLNESTSINGQGVTATVATNSGTDAIISSLKETLKEKSELEASVKSLQEKLAVSNAEADKLREELGKNKSVLVRLATLAHNSKDLPEKVSKLEEELKSKEQTISTLTQEKSRLDEGLNSKTSIEASKDAKITELNESLVSVKKDYESKLASMNESLTKAKAESDDKAKELMGKAEKSQRLAEDYKKLMNETADRYISSKALSLGVSANEIKNKLSNRYTLDDIDKVCESLGAYELNISKLPFSVDRKVSVQVSGQAEPLIQSSSDDDVDESTLKMAGLSK
jgi:chromosome segregation ATPase